MDFNINTGEKKFERRNNVWFLLLLRLDDLDEKIKSEKRRLLYQNSKCKLWIWIKKKKCIPYMTKRIN